MKKINEYRIKKENDYFIIFNEKGRVIDGPKFKSLEDAEKKLNLMKAFGYCK